jgi:hypothetical protein
MAEKRSPRSRIHQERRRNFLDQTTAAQPHRAGA